MKNFLFAFLMVLISVRLFAPGGPAIFIPEAEGINPYLQVWTAVKFVETGVHPATINYMEQAYGPGQIRQAKLDDYNLAHGTDFTLMECLEEGLSLKIFSWHCNQYNDIDLAIRRWNGSGPATFDYLKKVYDHANRCSTPL